MDQALLKPLPLQRRHTERRDEGSSVPAPAQGREHHHHHHHHLPYHRHQRDKSLPQSATQASTSAVFPDLGLRRVRRPSTEATPAGSTDHSRRQSTGPVREEQEQKAPVPVQMAPKAQPARTAAQLSREREEAMIRDR